LHAGGVSPGDVEFAAAVEPDLADSGLAVGDGATVSAGVAPDAVVADVFAEGRLGFADALIEDGAEGGHGVGSVAILAPRGIDQWMSTRATAQLRVDLL
jgi:hypothetical protein